MLVALAESSTRSEGGGDEELFGLQSPLECGVGFGLLQNVLPPSSYVGREQQVCEACCAVIVVVGAAGAAADAWCNEAIHTNNISHGVERSHPG